jgi:hypothetical protein
MMPISMHDDSPASFASPGNPPLQEVEEVQ